MLSNEDQMDRIRLNGGQQERMLSNTDQNIRIRFNGEKQKTLVMQ